MLSLPRDEGSEGDGRLLAADCAASRVSSRAVRTTQLAHQGPRNSMGFESIKLPVSSIDEIRDIVSILS